MGFLVAKGVITSTQADSILPTLAQDIALIVSGLVVVFWSYFEKASKGVLDAYFPPGKNSGSLPPSTRLLVLVLAPLAAGMSLVGCGSSGSTFTYTPSGGGAAVTITGFGAWCENNLTTIRAATKVTAEAGADFLINQGVTRTRIAGYVQSIVSILKPFLSGQPVTQAQLDAAATPLQLDNADGAWDQIASPVLTLIGGYLVTLEQENVPTKVIVDVLTAVINGFEDAAAIYTS